MTVTLTDPQALAAAVGVGVIVTLGLEHAIIPAAAALVERAIDNLTARWLNRSGGW